MTTLGSEKTKADRWVQCDGGAWVRWSSVVAIDIAYDHSRNEHEVIFMQVGWRHVYARFAAKRDADETVRGLLQNLDGDYG